jgi:apolipoprotein N-acyltransferase
MTAIRKSFTYTFATLLSGVLLWLSWPEKGFTFLIFFALIPLFFVENIFTTRGKLLRPGKMFAHFFLGMLTWNLLTTWWIYNSTDVGSFVAIGLNSLFMAIIWQLFHLVKRKQGSSIGYLSLLLFWIAFEYLHLNWEISWPWLTLGNVFATKPQWIQWYEYTGVLGGTFWILCTNLVLYQLAKNILIKDLLKKLRAINILLLSGIGLLLLAVPLGISYWMYSRHTDTGEPAKVVLIQPNVDPYNEKFSGTADEQLSRILRLGSSVADSTTEYFLGPETALPQGLWEESIETERPIYTIRKWLQAYPKADLLIGLTSFKSYGEGEERSVTARKMNIGTDYYDVFNAAMLLNYRSPVQLYHKSRLVPGVEKMPYPKIFGFLESYALELGGTSGSLGTQDFRINFRSQDNTKIAPAICYESIYGGFMSGYMRDTAAFIAIITNDGWWGNTPGYRQHMNYARLLAVSMRKSIARSANTGISCFINQRGDIVSKTNWWEEDAISGTVFKNKTITFYARHGDYIGFIAAYLGIALLLYIVLKKMVLWF